MPLGLMTAIAAASDDIFKLFEWNRDVYMFDKSQRLDREELRMKMQVERFDLFREDIKDLYELTVGRMDMYHLVGALFLHSCVVLLAEGRVQAVAPPFLLSMYWFNSSCAFVFLLYAVWLAMHASIAAQSFGTRLLLRYVRLPLPTNAQIDALSSTLAEYETQGMSNVLRVPFVQRSEWGPTDIKQEDTKSGPRFGGLKLETAPGAQPTLNRKLSQMSLPGVSKPSDPHFHHPPPPPDPNGRRGFLGKAEVPFSGEDDFMLSTSATPGQHVELFRHLQAKWNCFDAYARICMQFGVHHILLGLSYFAVNVMMVENRSPTCGWALVLLFQACQMGICVLDMSAYGKHFIAGLNLMSAAPLVTSIVSIALADRLPNGTFSDENIYPAAFLCFIFQLIWLELLLYVATPDSDDGKVPKKSRTVFYMDVFGDAEEAHESAKSQEEEEESGDQSPKTRNAHRRVRQQAESVRSSLAVVRATVELWEALPMQALSDGQRHELERARAQLELCVRVIKDQFEWCTQRQILPSTYSNGGEASPRRVNFGDALVGPFEKPSPHGPSTCYLDLAIDDFVWAVPDGRQVITLMRIFRMLQELKSRARELREAAVEASGDKSGLAAGIPKTREEYFSVLPWRVLSWTTRLVQLCLAWLAFAAILREQRLWKIDYHQKVGGERRLSWATGELSPWQLEVEWPQGLFFHPEALSCMPAGGLGGGRLLLGSPFRQYGADMADVKASAAEAGGPAASPPLRLLELAQSDFPPAAVALCAAPQDVGRGPPACLMGVVAADGVNIWPMGSGPSSGEAVLLPVDGRPWRRLAGAIIRCSDADLGWSTASVSGEWCLLLAGYDGESLPVAVLRLPGGPSAPPAAGERLRPRFDVPLRLRIPGNSSEPSRSLTEGAEPELDGERVALHLEPRRGRLWVLLDGGELEAWELLRPRKVGSWNLQWPQSQCKDTGFQGSALCEQDGQNLFVVGRGGASGPMLLRVRLPWGLDEEDEEGVLQEVAPRQSAGFRRLSAAWA